MDENDEVSNAKLGLELGLGLTKYVPKRDNSQKNKRVFFLDLSIPLQENDRGNNYPSSGLKFMEEDENQESKNIDFNGAKEDDDRNYSNNCSRKKLRLDKDQIVLLEDSFEQHSTLTMVQKQALAEKLKLRPRQVEVWFQNRRARSKLKQTEVDCEFLKRNCEMLTEENRQLKKQLLELKSSVKIEKSPPSSVNYPMQKTAVLIMCPSCENITRDRYGGAGKKELAAPAVVMELVLDDKANQKERLDN